MTIIFFLIITIIIVIKYYYDTIKIGVRFELFRLKLQHSSHLLKSIKFHSIFKLLSSVNIFFFRTF